MADQTHMTLLQQGRVQWNTWRRQHPEIRPDLRAAQLANADLYNTDLYNIDLRGANLRNADLRGANLCNTNLRNADLRGANLGSANLRGATLRSANLRSADLRGADLCNADLHGTHLRGAHLDSPRPKETRSSGKGRFWTALGYAALLTLAFFLALLHYLESFQYSATNGQLLDMVGNRGETMTINLHMGDSINGLWASDGLQLALQGVPQEIRVVPPSSPSWGDTLSTKNWLGGDSFTVSGAFTIPSSLHGSQDQVLSGEITGSITYPAPAFGGFEDTTTQITIPVRLRVVPSGYLPWESSGSLLLTVIGLDIILLICFPLLARALDARGQRALPESGKAAIVGGLIAGVLATSALGGLLVLLFEQGGPSAAEVGNIVLWLLIGLVGAAIGGAVRATRR